MWRPFGQRMLLQTVSKNYGPVLEAQGVVLRTLQKPTLATRAPQVVCEFAWGVPRWKWSLQKPRTTSEEHCHVSVVCAC